MKLTSFGLLGFLAVIASIGSGMPPAAAAETITMVTTGKGSAQQWPIFIAMTKGYMAENGVALDLVAAPSIRCSGAADCGRIRQFRIWWLDRSAAGHR